MQNKFNNFLENRIANEINYSLNILCEQIVESGISPEDALDNIVTPAVIQGNYETPAQLLNELGLFNRFFKKRNQVQPTSNEFEDEPMMAFQKNPYKNPNDFRARNNRMTDRLGANRDTQARNKEINQYNIGAQKRNIIGQGGQKLKQVRDEMFELTNTLKEKMMSYMSKLEAQKSENIPEHKRDILGQFIDYINKATENFKPNINMGKYAQDPDFSGVKSYKVKQPKTGNFYGPNGQYGINQNLGDQERMGEKMASQDYLNRKRKLDVPF